jgi:hypothetical protein
MYSRKIRQSIKKISQSQGHRIHELICIFIVCIAARKIREARGVCSLKHKTHRRQCKMSSFKQMSCKGTLRQAFICLRPRTAIPPPPPTHCIRVYSILIQYSQNREERGKGDLNQRESKTVNSSQRLVEIPT